MRFKRSPVGSAPKSARAITALPAAAPATVRPATAAPPKSRRRRTELWAADIKSSPAQKPFTPLFCLSLKRMHRGFFLKILPNFRKFIFARLDGFICALGVLPNRRLFPKRPKQVIIVGSGVAAACRSSRFSHIELVFWRFPLMQALSSSAELKSPLAAALCTAMSGICSSSLSKLPQRWWRV